jgi:SAM-dependent methyltransferase
VQCLIDDARITVVESDVYVSDCVDVACDGHALPFADRSLQGVVVQAVLEHVLDPGIVVSEIHRVLVDWGLVFAETPFLQPVHEGPHDFTRWTESGHRRLFRAFSEIERGVVAGPGSSLAWALCYFVRSLAPGGSFLSKVAFAAARLAFGWIRHADRWLIDRPGGIDAAAGVYFVGARSSAVVTDGEILSGYRGAISCLHG